MTLSPSTHSFSLFCFSPGSTESCSHYPSFRLSFCVSVLVLENKGAELWAFLNNLTFLGDS
jgi:hypothetical protein